LCHQIHGSLLPTKRSISQQTYVETTFPCLVLKTILILHTSKINLRINIAILSFCPFSFVLSLLHIGPSRSWSYANWSYQLGLPVVITTKVYGEVYSMQHYMTKLVSDVGCFLRFPPPVKLTSTIQLKYCWKWSIILTITMSFI
jgi:hypothetical protein